VKLDCDHVVTIEAMDNMNEFAKFCDVSSSGEIQRIKQSCRLTLGDVQCSTCLKDVNTNNPERYAYVQRKTNTKDLVSDIVASAVTMLSDTVGAQSELDGQLYMTEAEFKKIFEEPSTGVNVSVTLALNSITNGIASIPGVYKMSNRQSRCAL